MRKGSKLTEEQKLKLSTGALKYHEKVKKALEIMRKIEEHSVQEAL